MNSLGYLLVSVLTATMTASGSLTKCGFELLHAESDTRELRIGSVRIADITRVLERDGLLFFSTSPLYGTPEIGVVDCNDGARFRIVSAKHTTPAYPSGTDYFELRDAYSVPGGYRLQFLHADDIDAVDFPLDGPEFLETIEVSGRHAKFTALPSHNSEPDLRSEMLASWPPCDIDVDPNDEGHYYMIPESDITAEAGLEGLESLRGLVNELLAATDGNDYNHESFDIGLDNTFLILQGTILRERMLRTRAELNECWEENDPARQNALIRYEAALADYCRFIDESRYSD